MNLLIDACVAARVARSLAELGHDVEWVGDWPSHHSDEMILSAATRDRRVIVTLDKDFGELAVRDRVSTQGIVRLAGLSLRDQVLVCADVLTRYAKELESGALLTVSPGRVRIRQPG